MPRYWKPILLLLLLTPFITELLTNNIPVSHFFKVNLFFTLVLLVYGPVLILRETAITWNLNLTGYLFLGLVYGIYNEGLLAKTFFQSQIANTTFNDYGFVGGVNTPWASVMIVFHAFYSFLFPIIIVYNIFPKVAFTPWLQRKWLIIFSIAYLLCISYKFLKNTYPAKPHHYIVLVVIITCLINLSRLFKGGLKLDDKKPHVWFLCCYGILFVATTFTLAHIIASTRIHFAFFLVYVLINMLVAVILLNKEYGIRSLLIFVLAAQMGFALSAVIVAVSVKSEIGIITGIIFAALFFTMLILVFLIRKKRSHMQKTGPSIEIQKQYCP